VHKEGNIITTTEEFNKAYESMEKDGSIKPIMAGSGLVK
jgi:hypothetical protein